jgi:hypothetical protein
LWIRSLEQQRIALAVFVWEGKANHFVWKDIMLYPSTHAYRCFHSLLVAVIQTLQTLARNARQRDGGGLLVCIGKFVVTTSLRHYTFVS